MPVSRTHLRPRAALCVGLVALGLGVGLPSGLAGCAEKPPPAPTYGPAEHTYTVRGEVVELPVANDPKTSFRVKHEPIPDYKNREGVAVGMATMTMGFTPAEGVSLEGIQKGDKVEFVWEMWYRPRMRERITSIRKLPAETQLNFGR